MSEEMMSTKEVAKYLDIHEKQVYALIKLQRIPATRITGKWVFPRKLIDEWIESDAKTGLKQPEQKRKRGGEILLASGSNDPILDMLLTYMKRSYPEFNFFVANTGSVEGLKALDRGYTDISWSHLFDPKTKEYNLPFLAAYLPHLKPVVVNLFCRELGFILAPKNSFAIHGFEDLTRKEVRFINRQKGSGTRVLLDYHLKRLGIPTSGIQGYEKEVYTHFEVGLSILSDEADVGIATSAVSKLLSLRFIPIAQERFDMILDQSTYFEKSLQAFIEVLNSEGFRKRIAGVANYDFKNSGKILYAEN